MTREEFEKRYRKKINVVRQYENYIATNIKSSNKDKFNLLLQFRYELYR